MDRQAFPGRTIVRVKLRGRRSGKKGGPNRAVCSKKAEKDKIPDPPGFPGGQCPTNAGGGGQSQDRELSKKQRKSDKCSWEKDTRSRDRVKSDQKTTTNKN